MQFHSLKRKDVAVPTLYRHFVTLTTKSLVPILVRLAIHSVAPASLVLVLANLVKILGPTILVLVTSTLIPIPSTPLDPRWKAIYH